MRNLLILVLLMCLTSVALAAQPNEQPPPKEPDPSLIDKLKSEFKQLESKLFDEQPAPQKEYAILVVPDDPSRYNMPQVQPDPKYYFPMPQIKEPKPKAYVEVVPPKDPKDPNQKPRLRLKGFSLPKEWKDWLPPKQPDKPDPKK